MLELLTVILFCWLFFKALGQCEDRRIAAVRRCRPHAGGLPAVCRRTLASDPRGADRHCLCPAESSGITNLLQIPVIANQPAGWCGNLLRFRGFPRQFANWLGMT